jgi:DNA-directed RNA polymerase subunit M/transcription elongation factor TFIIS
MDCPKCKGFMELARFSDFFLVFYAWKCLNCGAIIDRTIAENRRKSLDTKIVGTDKVEAAVSEAEGTTVATA